MTSSYLSLRDSEGLVSDVDVEDDVVFEGHVIVVVIANLRL